MKPFAETAEENKAVVLPILQPYLNGVDTALEIASGTGQQIVYFAEKHPEIVWQASDLAENIPDINSWVRESQLPNLREPLVIDVASPNWPIHDIPFIYTSNSLHIMSWSHVENFFENAGRLLRDNAYFCIYGPFSFDGQHISESNKRFDAYLIQRNAGGGVRDTSALISLGSLHGLSLQHVVDMPHNNHILIWQKV